MHKARRKFKLALDQSGYKVTFQDSWGPLRVEAEGAHALADLVIQCRLHGKLITELARFVGDITRQRVALFRKLGKHV